VRNTVDNNQGVFQVEPDSGATISRLTATGSARTLADEFGRVPASREPASPAFRSLNRQLTSLPFAHQLRAVREWTIEVF
jgi:hypothetical protein